MFISKKKYEQLINNYEKEKQNLINENDRITHEARNLKLSKDKIIREFDNYKAETSEQITNLINQNNSLEREAFTGGIIGYSSDDLKQACKKNAEQVIATANDKLMTAYNESKKRQKKADAKPTAYMTGLSDAVKVLDSVLDNYDYEI